MKGGSLGLGHFEIVRYWAFMEEIFQAWIPKIRISTQRGTKPRRALVEFSHSLTRRRTLRLEPRPWPGALAQDSATGIVEGATGFPVALHLYAGILQIQSEEKDDDERYAVAFFERRGDLLERACVFGTVMFAA